MAQEAVSRNQEHRYYSADLAACAQLCRLLVRTGLDIKLAGDAVWVAEKKLPDGACVFLKVWRPHPFDSCKHTFMEYAVRRLVEVDPQPFMRDLWVFIVGFRLKFEVPNWTVCIPMDQPELYPGPVPQTGFPSCTFEKMLPREQTLMVASSLINFYQQLP